MEAIFLTDDELKRLETRLGPFVRQMGPWNSDGIFGYASVSIMAVEKAAETLANPKATDSASAPAHFGGDENTSSNCWRILARPWWRESLTPTGSFRFRLVHRC